MDSPRRSKSHDRCLLRCVSLVMPAALLASGCQLVGYGTARQQDAGGLTRDDEGLDAATAADAATVSAFDSRAPQDSSAFVRDSASDGAADAQTDSSAVCAVTNACGGCSSLASAPASSCGVCGLGRNACDGSDALVCNGGDARPTASSAVQLIDDFEDGDSNVLASSGFDGYWFAYSDHTAGTLEPPDGSRITPASTGAAGTARSAHIKGSGFTSFGAGLILRINAAECYVDLSATRGIGFWVKGKSPMTLSIATVQTLDPQYCGTSCKDHYNAVYTLTNSWQHYTIAYSELKQSGWGTKVSFDPTQEEYLQFSFGANVGFELYLDEVGFY